jgi:hypothetical protein
LVDGAVQAVVHSERRDLVRGVAELFLDDEEVGGLLNQALLAKGVVEELGGGQDHLVLDPCHLPELQRALPLHLDQLVVAGPVVECREGKVVEHRDGVERVILQPHIVPEGGLAHVLHQEAPHKPTERKREECILDVLG